MRKVKRGDAFLPDVGVPEIESLQAKNTDYKIKCILQAVLLRKAGKTLRGISEATGFSNLSDILYKSCPFLSVWAGPR